ADAISPPINFDHTSYVQTGLANGTTYYYIVTAVDAAGESTPSLQACATAGPPAAPSLAVTPYSAQITLSWDPVPSATSYNVYWSATPGVTPATGTRITGAASQPVDSTYGSYVQTGLVNGTTYYYVVTAVNAAGESAPSAQLSATPFPTVIPAAPTGLFAVESLL